MPRWIPVSSLVCFALLVTPISPASATASASAPPQPAGSGVVLDGYGGLHVIGGAALNSANAPYWRGWDIARSLALIADGSGGWELDGYGGIHPFGAASSLPPGPYWSGWDIARALVVNPGGASGYVLDGFGGVHPVGATPYLAGFPYWKGWDIARGLDIHYSAAGKADGGWVLDGYGGIHQFGAAPQLPSTHYYPGFDFWQRIHVTGNGTGAYLLGRWNIADQVGTVAGLNWNGYPSWGGWDIARDLVPLQPGAAWVPQPAERAADGALMNALNNPDRDHRGLGTLSGDLRLTGIAGDNSGYNLGACGGSGSIADRSQDMFLRNYFDHVIPGCRSTDYVWQTYFPYNGVAYRAAGENIGWISVADLPDAAWQINNAWLNSPEHLANITSAQFGAIGCGGFTGTGYQGQAGQVWIWTCDFRG